MSKELTLFYMNGCPYCRQADRAVEELTAKSERYRSVKIRKINENMSPEIAEQYDYYYVPTIFLGKEKLYEARPGESYEECKAHVQESLERAITG